MKFGAAPVASAAGAVLAHGVDAGGSSNSYWIKKGTVLTRKHVADLAAAGHLDVTVARLEPGDVAEDAAAARLAAAIVPNPQAQGLRVGRAGTGRVNLKADHAGVVQLDAGAISAMNRLDPMLTLATLRSWQRVEAGHMVATIKIISYAVAQEKLDAACKVAARALQVLPAVVGSATLIETHVGAGEPSDKGRRAMAARLARFGVQLTDRVVVPHESAPLAAALADAAGEVVLILTASATSDIRDTAPQALCLSGGQVDHFGMPVDPGNLLFLGTRHGKPVIGLPGCARSLTMNGADWVLDRILCGVPVTAEDIADMGVGGLLKDIPQRGLARDSTG